MGRWTGVPSGTEEEEIKVDVLASVDKRASAVRDDEGKL